jgi:transcription elongation factor GreA
MATYRIATPRGMQSETVQLTPEGRRELEAELAGHEAERPVVAARIAEARAGGGDPTENLELRDAQDALALLDGRIAQLRALLDTAKPLEKPAAGGAVQLGVTARVRHADGEEATYTLVSWAEADPRRGRISAESPIGRALAGCRKGDEVTAETPTGPERLVVVDIT